MENTYIVLAGKIVTVSEIGTVLNGALIVQNGKIAGVLEGDLAKKFFPSFPTFDFSDKVITPSMVDCHTHLLEFAPGSLYPITEETQLHAGSFILVKALMSGITGFGEQICGHPQSLYSITDYKNAVKELPLDIAFAATSISIGFKSLAHFTSITKSQPVEKEDLIRARILFKMAGESDYPGENLFLNATPANFTKDVVPRAGELIYSEGELKDIVRLFHSQGKEIGVHVAGEKGIDMALNTGVDVLHHAHGINDRQLQRAAENGVKVVATPLGGTHIEPNSPEDILQLVHAGIETSIATDAYLPPYPDVDWLPYKDQSLKGPEVLMEISQPSMKKLQENGCDENDILKLITSNPAKLIGGENKFGKLRPGMDANFIITEGIPGLEITNPEKIKSVYYHGKCVIKRD
ncbi:amidohydrolase family protein [Oceanobacillus senegalensis]|uniref:amidohydrolase family protein n=1 Tax=Oceanobacillus senegalensis TaxID=1936063 RepID=UPI000A309CA7|nr:amidohydrolase family protein [Oceanobacillus senegalensis]